MEIRRFTENDSIPDVSRVYALSWKAAYSKFISRDYLCSIKENAWYEYLAGVLPNLWLASECGQIIGVCTYGPARDKACRAWGEIVSLYTCFRKPTGKGTGQSCCTQLWAACLQWAAAASIYGFLKITITPGGFMKRTVFYGTGT